MLPPSIIINFNTSRRLEALRTRTPREGTSAADQSGRPRAVLKQRTLSGSRIPSGNRTSKPIRKTKARTSATMSLPGTFYFTLLTTSRPSRPVTPVIAILIKFLRRWFCSSCTSTLSANANFQGQDCLFIGLSVHKRSPFSKHRTGAPVSSLPAGCGRAFLRASGWTGGWTCSPCRCLYLLCWTD